MRYWERLSKTIFKLAALPLLKKVQPKSIEAVLRNSLLLLNEETGEEIRRFIGEKQTLEGGFADRAGHCDLYYSLFGYFIADAYGMPGILPSLKKYVEKEVTTKDLNGVHLYCGAILYAKLFGFDDVSIGLSKKIRIELIKTESSKKEYSSFLGFLALYYLEDFLSLKRLINNYKKTSSAESLSSANRPCPVTAANLVLFALSGTPHHQTEKNLRAFCQKNGGFMAVKHAPCEDMLSTGVALYALHFIDADMRLLKPECLSFVDNLYDGGGFRATQTDFDIDVEYTFYGLLALGSLK